MENKFAFAGQDLDEYKVPVFTQDKSKKYVNYGEDNLYPFYLVDLFNRSAKHNAILTGKNTYIYGQGLKMEGASPLFETPNRFESLTEIFNKVLLDKLLYGGYALQIIWDRLGQNIAEIYHMDFSKIRSNVDNTEFFYSNEWGEYNAKYKPYKAFNPDKREGTQIYYYRDYRPATTTYPLPEYIGAIPYIECDVQIANYHRANLHNEFFFGGILSFNNGVPTQDEKDKLVKALNKRHQGTDNAGRWIINFSDGKDKEPTSIPFQPNELDKQFEILNEQVQQEIFVAHKITSPMFFGIRTEGQLGGRNEMIDAYKLFDQNYVKPVQQHFGILFTYLLSFNGSPKVEVVPLEMFKPQFSEQTLIQIATRPEMREMAGLAPEPETPEPVQMSDQSWEKEIEVFSQFGETADNYEEIESRLVSFSDDHYAFESHLEFNERELMEFAKVYEPSEEERKVLEIVKKDPLMGIQKISQEAGITEGQTKTIIKKLDDEGILKKTDNVWNILKTPPPVDVLDRVSKELAKFSVKYKYTGPRDNKNRDFCRAMLNLNRVYTREEIDKISKIVDRNVWTRRGGWQTVKGTDIHLPYCRHNWASVLVKKKS